MTAVQATGRVERDRAGLELFFERRLSAPVEEVWELVSLISEDDDFTIVESTPLARISGTRDGFRFSISLAGLGENTALFASQRVATARDAGIQGPRWEYSLDRLVAAQAGTALPEFDDYASQVPYFERLAMDGDPQAWPAS